MTDREVCFFVFRHAAQYVFLYIKLLLVKEKIVMVIVWFFAWLFVLSIVADIYITLIRQDNNALYDTEHYFKSPSRVSCWTAKIAFWGLLLGGPVCLFLYLK